MAGNLFGGPTRTNISTAPSTTMRIQTSLQGRPLSLGWGQGRCAGNLVWYGNLISRPASGAGGKGGAVSSVLGKGGGNYKYTAAGIVSLADGPISEVLTVYNGNSIDFLVAPPQSILDDLALLGIIPSYGDIYNTTFFEGTYPQAIWAWLQAFLPSQAIPYPGEALACYQKVDLGSSPSFPNFNYELLFNINSDVPALGPDANPADVITDFLTNPDRGVQGFPSVLLGDLSNLRNYSRASGLMISPLLTDQQAATSPLADWMKGLACDFFWSTGTLQVTPYADRPVSGNGYEFTPVTTPVYDLDDDDFLPNQGSLGNNSDDTPVAISRKDPATILNQVQLEYLDRSNLYNPVTIYASNDALIIATNRLRLSDLRAHHFFCLASAAATSVQLQLAREQISLHYEFTLGREFILLDPMDIITLTSPSQGLNKTPVRIVEVQENEEGTLTMTAEEYLGTIGPALYARQPALGTALNYNAPSGSVNTPIFFEPPDALAGDLELYAIASGALTQSWGGYYLWLSTDDANYQLLPGQVVGAARQGVLTAALPAVTPSATGQTIDSTNVCAVDLSESDGALGSGSPSDMTNLNTLCLVDNELIAYQTAALTGANEYNLSPLVRGAYGTTISSHAIGAPFAALGSVATFGSNNGIYSYAYPANLIGTQVFFKFQSFNSVGGGIQQLSDVGAYTYTLTGAALSSPLPDITNLYSNFEGGFQKIYWDEVDDFRSPILYEIRQGATWAGGLVIRTQAHPPFIAQGTGTFWVAAKCTPITGLTVYSEVPQNITISGNQLSLNLIETYDEQANGWPGTFQAGIATEGTGTNKFLRLTGAQNILTAAPFLESVATVAATPSGNVLSFASVPSGIVAGMAVADKTNPSAIQNNVTVQSTTSTTVTLTAPVAGAGVGSGDVIIFSLGDVLSGGGIITNTPIYYTSAKVVDIGYVAQTSINATTLITGVPVGQDILSDPNVLADADILGSSSTALVDGWIEIAISQDAVSWGAWQKFVPGVQLGRAFRFRLALESADPTAIPTAQKFNYQVQVPGRIDHYQNLNISSGGLTIIFTPDGTTTPAPFNFGPNANGLPYVSVSYSGSAGEYYTITGLSLSQLTITFYNSSGIAIAQSGVNIDTEGA